MAKLQRLGVMSVAKLYALMMAIAGLIMGLFTSIMSIFSAVMFPSGAWGVGFGIASIIILPIIFAILGFICGSIGSFLYNIIAGKFGGIEMDFD